MYDELIKSIRQNTCHFDACGMCLRGKIPCPDRLALQAADAIEELQQIAAHNKQTAKDYWKEACDYKAAIPRWVPMEERLPDFEGSVLCLRKSYIHPGVKHQEIMYVDEHGFCNKDDIYAEPGNVTHWMPLPEPPKEE